MKQTENFVTLITKLHCKCLNKQFSSAPLTSGSSPEKFKVIELAEQNNALEQEIVSLKAQLTQQQQQYESYNVDTNNVSRNGNISKSSSVRKI